MNPLRGLKSLVARHRGLASLIVIVLPLVLVAACSGKSSTSGGVSKADYLRQAEAICTKSAADQKALKTPTAVADLAPYVAKVVALADTTALAVDALEPPKADKSDLESKLLTPLKAELVEAHTYSAKVAAAQKRHDEAALVELLSKRPAMPPAVLTWMRSYGFSSCVTLLDTSS